MNYQMLVLPETIIGIDPGSSKSALVYLKQNAPGLTEYVVKHWMHLSNESTRDWLIDNPADVVGVEIPTNRLTNLDFTMTALWAGRFMERSGDYGYGVFAATARGHFGLHRAKDPQINTFIKERGGKSLRQAGAHCRDATVIALYHLEKICNGTCTLA